MAEKTKTYTHEQVEKLLSQTKTKIDQLKADVAERDSKIEELSDKCSLLEKKKSDLDRREAELVPKEKTLEEEKQKLTKDRAEFDEKRAEVEGREIALKSQEKAFEAIKTSLVNSAEELATKKTELFSGAEKLASELYEKRISETEKMVQQMRDAAKSDGEKLRTEAETAAEKIRNEALAAAEKIRAEAQTERDRIVKEADEEAKSIISKAKSDTNALETQIADLIKKNADLSGENTKLASQNAALSGDKQKLDLEIKNQKREFDETTATYAKTMAAFETLKVQLEENGKSVSDFTTEIAKMDTREQELNAFKDELNERDRKLKFFEKRNENKTQDLEERESNLDEEVKVRYPEILADKEREIETLKQELEQQRQNRVTAESLLNVFKDIKADLGERNPITVLEELKAAMAELNTLRDDVNNPASYINKKASDLQEREDNLAERENALTQKERQTQEIQDNFAQAQAENAELKLKNDNLEKDKKIVEEQLARLRSTYENPAERDERIKEINKPLIADPLPRLESSKLSETEWLGNIEEKIEKSGLYFPRRILNAFHTALKTSEMSPLTVLAGVSGTGKSELPRLYSRFGGINFLGVPVQPNWDCQEAMLGYYNSIDNCFEPTDMLRLLAQSQRNVDDQNGLNDVMTMILLDEMNLANVELYFADFLSKLETRRGLADNDPTFPKIGVKIGSKMADFPLRLGRNVLWTGTMNNDETTKTLSDKVLDRGIVINFPRPKKLIRTRTDSVLAEASELLPKAVWSSWIDNAYKFSDEQIKDKKDKIEQINEQLGKTGRALGHRVWQSIESYMSLYPTVIAAQSNHERQIAMDDAFEDQLVQKVMPKLRGLETRGTQNDVLDAIKGIIPETLHEDFKNASEQNYGQFIWTTSGYLLRGEDSVEKKEADNVLTVNSQTTDEKNIDYEQIKADIKEQIEKGQVKDYKAFIPNYLLKHFNIDDKKKRSEITKSLIKDLSL